MIAKISGNTYIATGRATKTAEMKIVGEKKTPVTQWSIAAGKRQDTTTIFVDCKAWREVARAAVSICKGDSVCVIGEYEEREYNGKTYKTLVCEWLNVCKVPGNLEKLSAMVSAASTPSPAPAASSDFMSDLQDSDGELPF